MERLESNSNWSGWSEPDPSVFSASVLNRVAVGVYTVDVCARCTQVNASLLGMLGYTEAECLGQDMHALLHSKRPDGSAYPAEECPLYRAGLTGEPIHDLEEVMWKKNGEPVYVVCSSRPITAHSSIVGTVVTLNDVTSRRHAEERLRQMESEQREALRQRDAAARIERDLASEQARNMREATAVVERAAAEQLRHQEEMVQERLIESEKLAAVGRLAASISHEINNPLEAVTNLLYLARNDDTLSGEGCEYLRQAEVELRRVTEIVSQTLRFQRGKSTVSNCDPESIIESVLALHQGRLRHARVRIDRQHRRMDGFRCVEGDLRQILNNLLSNAIDAMRETGGVITVRSHAACCPRTGDHGVRISVADTGHGMSPATMAQVFKPMYTTKGTSGSGLGMWISSTLARRNGGRLAVRSRKGEPGTRGTIFSLFLPEAGAREEPIAA